MGYGIFRRRGGQEIGKSVLAEGANEVSHALLREK